MRVIAINRRGFGQSTPLRADEIGYIRPPPRSDTKIQHSNPLQGSAEAHAAFHEHRVHEIAHCLKKLNAISTDGTGITLMGWSLGNLYCVKLIDMLQSGHLPELENIVKGYIAYGNLLF